jgi:hypothetical protein
MTPREAKTFDELCKLPRDNVDTDAHWLMADVDTVTIAAQRNSEECTAKVKLPRATFEAFIDWYNTGKWKARRSRKQKV